MLMFFPGRDHSLPAWEKIFIKKIQQQNRYLKQQIIY